MLAPTHKPYLQVTGAKGKSYTVHPADLREMNAFCPCAAFTYSCVVTEQHLMVSVPTKSQCLFYQLISGTSSCVLGQTCSGRANSGEDWKVSGDRDCQGSHGRALVFGQSVNFGELYVYVQMDHASKHYGSERICTFGIEEPYNDNTTCLKFAFATDSLQWVALRLA